VAQREWTTLEMQRMTKMRSGPDPVPWAVIADQFGVPVRTAKEAHQRWLTQQKKWANT
jgi:hypothetical protein